MKRTEGWRDRLGLFIQSRYGRPFSWGSNDCAMFAADAIKEMTGTDMAEKFRGYQEPPGRAVAKSLEHIMEHVCPIFGLQEIPSYMALAGDLVLLENPDKKLWPHALGIVGTNGEPVTVRPDEGVVSVPPELIARAWRV